MSCCFEAGVMGLLPLARAAGERVGVRGALGVLHRGVIARYFPLTPALSPNEEAVGGEGAEARRRFRRRSL